MQRFPPAEQAFWYVVYFGTIAIAAVGLVSISFLGMNRYMLLALPLFFCMGRLTRPQLGVLAFWLLVSAWHYWQVDLCIYTAGPGNRGLEVCHMNHWIGRI